MSVSRLASLAVALLLAACALAGAGCEARPRDNPLDPQNPMTGGGPIGFRALGGGDGVTLMWNPAPARADLIGFKLERRRTGPDDFEPLGPILPLQSTGTLDATALTDFDYDYRLSFVATDSSTSGAPALATARPGREVVWVADPAIDQIVRLTPDGRERVLTIGGVRSVNRISFDLSDGVVWGTEPFDGRAKVFTALGSPLSTFPAGSNPNAIAVDNGTGTAWICDENGGAVVRYTQAGNPVADAGLFENPQDVAIKSSGGAWIVDSAVGTVTPIALDGSRGTPIAVGGDPRRIAVDALDGSIWVSRFGANEVVHLSPAGAVLSRTPLPGGPYAIDLDELRNLVWVGVDQLNAVVSLDRASGAEVRRVAGIPRPRGLAVADRTGEVWVAAIASGEVVRISSDGVIVGRNARFDAPIDVRVDPGPRVVP